MIPWQGEHRQEFRNQQVQKTLFFFFSFFFFTLEKSGGDEAPKTESTEMVPASSPSAALAEPARAAPPAPAGNLNVSLSLRRVTHCTSTCPGCAPDTIPALLEATSPSQLNQSFPQHGTAQLDESSAPGSPHFVLSPLRFSASSSSSFVPQLLGNQDHIKVELEKLKKAQDEQQQKLEERV